MRGKFLFIDKDVSCVHRLAHAMERDGHETRVAGNSSDALNLVECYHPDVVLCEIDMPDIDGYEICVAMRRLPSLHHTLFIANASWSSRTRRALARQAGYHHHLVKPIDMNMMHHATSLGLPTPDTLIL